MPDLEAFRAALRAEAEALPATPLLSGVRARARDLQRRRLAGLTSLVVVVLAVLSGVGWLALGQSGQSVAPGVGTSLTEPKNLVGPTWRLLSWTTSDGTIVAPTTDRPPTLVFDSLTAAHSDDPVNTTSWIVRLGNGTAFGVEGPTTAVAEASGSLAANEALTSVLSGQASWQVTGESLILRNATAGRSVTYTRLPSAGAPTSSTVQQSVAALQGTTWWLVSVTRYGRTWQPIGARPAGLRFISATAVETDDGANTEEWAVAGSGGRLRWQGGETTAASEDASALQVSGAVDAVLGASPAWSLDGSELVFRSAGRSLTYSRTAPPARAEPTGLAVFVDLDPPGGAIARGQSLHLVNATVTVTDSAGKAVLSVRVEKDDSGESVLPPGAYIVTAVREFGSCKPSSATVVSGQVSEVDVVCLSGS